MPTLLTCNSLPPVSWQALPAVYGQDEVAIFGVRVAENSQHAPRQYALLAADEQRRAQRYHRAPDRHRFLVARAALRVLLGAYLKQPPSTISFGAGLNHKPRLAAAPSVHFNVAHAGDWVLLAIAAGEVGVDVERIAPDFPFQEVLDYSFSLAEKNVITQHPASRALFYQSWTRKEAFVKATGQGMTEDFGHLPSLDGQHYLATTPSPVAAWAVSSFGLATGYAAAVAYPATVAPSQLAFYEAGEALFLNL